MRHTRAGMAAALAVVCMIAVPALGNAGYDTLAPWSVINGPAPGASTHHYSIAIEGNSSYHCLGLGSNARITKIADLTASPQTATELLSQSVWAAASGKSSITSFYGFGISGDYVQFSEASADSVWRVDKNTGAISAYVTAANIMAYTGATKASCLSANTVAPSGEHVFYEGESDSILITTGAGMVTTLVSEAQLTALHATGSNSCNGGLGYDDAGNLYWGDSSSDGIYMRAADGTLSQVLTQANIIGVTGETSASFGDIMGGGDTLGAGDGLVYFYERTSDGIMRFDPDDPVNTLETYIYEARLVSGQAGSDNVYELDWYDDELAFNTDGGNLGLYVVPEPASLVLLALGGLAVLRRR